MGLFLDATDSVEPIHPLITSTWPVSDPFQLALWLGALTAVAHRSSAHLDGDLGKQAEITLACWPARARA